MLDTADIVKDGDLSPTIITCCPNIEPAKLLGMFRSRALMLSFWILVYSASIQTMHAQSTETNDLQATVVMTKLAPLTYPPLARKLRLQGTVQIRVGVRRDGTVESATVVSGHPMLGPAAQLSAKDSVYECWRCSEAVTIYSLTYTFRLEVQSTGQSETTPVTQVGNRVTVIDEPPTVSVTIYDPSSAFRARSAKCLYLWKCGIR